MKVFAVIAAFLQLSRCSHVSVRLPYQNPAGVTYVNGYQGHEYPVSYGNGAVYDQQPQALQYQSPALVSHQYQSSALDYQSQASLQYQTPNLQYQTPLRYAAPAAVYPAKVEAHHVGYAAAQVPAVAAVPFVKHVPTVSHVPVTRYEAHHGLIEKQVDVAKPAISTRKFEVRRPAIQKQFYDIEERVIIRPAGSALVELDEPTSKLQRGPAVLSESSPSHISATPSSFTHQLFAQANAFSQSPSSPNSIPVVAHAPVHVTVAPVISNSPVSHYHNPATAPSSSDETTKPDEESVVVDNADFRNAQFESQRTSVDSQRNSQFSGNLFRSSSQTNDEQVASRGQIGQYQDFQRAQFEASQSEKQNQQQNQDRQRNSSPNIIARSNGSPVEAIARFAESQDSGSSSVFASTRSSPEESRNNQQRLIELLTARGGVAEVGFGRDGGASSLGNAGNVRARVLSATPSPDYAEPTGERVSTRRVVVSKPVETLQEIDVLEPATKFQRISVQQPTLFKTAHLDHVQVHGSVPVIGKALTPTIAHAAVPVYQKTITPAAYQYYGR